MIITSCDSVAQKKGKENEEHTTYYLIRHAEKDRSDAENRNPNLKTEGLERAERWAVYFSEIELDAVYSTEYNRTQQTAQPTATAQNLEILSYDPTSLYDDAFAKANAGKTVLVVGHSNTTPAFANAILGTDQYPSMSDTDNASLYKVTITAEGNSSEIIRVDQ